MRGADGIPSELSWESCPGPVEGTGLQETPAHTALPPHPVLLFKPNSNPVGEVYNPHPPDKETKI